MQIVETRTSDRYALSKNSETISISAKVGLVILHILDSIDRDKGSILYPPIVIDVILFEEVGFGIDDKMVFFSLVVIIPIPINFDSMLITSDILPFFFEIPKHFHGS